MEPSLLEHLTGIINFVTKYNVPLLTIATLISTIGTFVLAILTYRYVRISEGMLKEMNDSHDPVVILDYQNDESKLNISVHNVGKSPAKNIKIYFIIINIPWKEYKNPPTFIPYIAPETKLTLFIGIPDYDEIDKVWIEINRLKGFWESIFRKKVVEQPTLDIQYEYESDIYTYKNHMSKRILTYHKKPFYNRLTIIVHRGLLELAKN